MERTFAETIAEFCNLARAKLATDPSAQRSCMRWIKRWPDMRLNQLSPEELKLYFAELSQLRFSASDLEQERNLLEAIYSWACRSGLTRSNPARLVPTFRNDDQEERRRTTRRDESSYWNVKEQFRLMQACRINPDATDSGQWTPPLYLAPLVWLLLHTGLRLGNILLLEWRHIDLLTEMVNLPEEETHSQKPLEVRLSRPATKLLLKLWQSARKSDARPRWVFRHLDLPLNKQGAIDIGPIYEAFREARIRARIAPGSFETLRQSFAHNCFSRGDSFIHVATSVDWDDLSFLIQLYQTSEAVDQAI